MGSVFERITVTFAGVIRTAGSVAGGGGDLWGGVVYNTATNA